MDKLTLMEIFVRIVETGSFSAVAREGGMTQPTVSKQMTALERSLKTRLLNRSTRSLSMTEAGAAYCGALPQHHRPGARRRDQPRRAAGNPGRHVERQLIGWLRSDVSVPPRARFPSLASQVSVLLTLNDRYIDLVEEGIDVAVRFGRLNDSSLVARRLAGSPVAVVASPAYLEQHGVPLHPNDLTRHHCLHYTHLSTGNEWVFPGPGGDIRVRIAARFRTQQRLRRADDALWTRNGGDAAGVHPAGAQPGRCGPGAAGLHRLAATRERGLSLGPFRFRQGAHLHRLSARASAAYSGAAGTLAHAMPWRLGNG